MDAITQSCFAATDWYACTLVSDPYAYVDVSHNACDSEVSNYIIIC